MVEKLPFLRVSYLKLLLEFPPGELACNLVMTGASSFFLFSSLHFLSGKILPGPERQRCHILSSLY